MDYGTSIAVSLKNMNAEIKRLNTQLKIMREEKKKTEERLYNWMTKRGIDDYCGFKRDRIKPKEKTILKRKPKKQKIEDALKLFRDAGIPDPEEFYMQYQGTQKAIPPNEEDEE